MLNHNASVHVQPYPINCWHSGIYALITLNVAQTCDKGISKCIFKQFHFQGEKLPKVVGYRYLSFRLNQFVISNLQGLIFRVSSTPLGSNFYYVYDNAFRERPLFCALFIIRTTFTFEWVGGLRTVGCMFELDGGWVGQNKSELCSNCKKRTK